MNVKNHCIGEILYVKQIHIKLIKQSTKGNKMFNLFIVSRNFLPIIDSSTYIQFRKWFLYNEIL